MPTLSLFGRTYTAVCVVLFAMFVFFTVFPGIFIVLVSPTGSAI